MRKFIEVNAFAFFAFILFLVVDIYADSTCKILGRIQIDSVLEAKPICTSGLRINDISQYLVARMVGVEKVNADLYLEKKEAKGYSQIATSMTKNSSTESIDLTNLAVGEYRVCAKRGAAQGSGLIHISFDIVSSSCETGRDTCFGAIGKNCEGGLGGTCHETTPDGLKVCQVAIGSQMHDTCCSSNPNGNHCGGNESLTACTKEWDHAVNDTAAAGRNWAVTFNPTIVTYRGSGESLLTQSLTIGDKNTAKPLEQAFRAPVGIDIWDIDAEQGWCVNPKRYTKSCAPLTNNCWARCK
ncbi:MAG: hypothetical protein KBF99_19335 [Leptospiraceae bacterium]|nr:hypothetical protein [Leptospiraceae bacterium]MBL0265719.1 hypothetical protein [Leptospiraceae bacterium]MBP9165344.1 hypothetical protein [Leptospiraceae bacterium]